MRRSIACLTLCLAAATATLTGCDNSGGATTATLSSLAVVQAASDVTQRSGSADMSLTSSTMTRGLTEKITGTGAIDGTSAGRFTLTIDMGTTSTTLQELYTKGYLYLQIPSQNSSYYKLALSDLVGTSLASSTDPTGSFAVLKAAGNLKVVGKQTLRGVATTHYTGTFNIAAALAKLGGAEKSLLQASFAHATQADIPFDAYLDAQGRVREFTDHLTLTVAKTTVTNSTTVELYNFGTTVKVTAPAAGQTQSGAPLLAALKQAAARAGTS